MSPWRSAQQKQEQQPETAVETPGHQGQHDRGRGRHFGGLDHAGAARRQREGQFLRQDPEREVPGRDDADHADRIAQHDTERVFTEGVVAVAVQVARQGRRVVPQVGRAFDFGERLGQPAAHFGHQARVVAIVPDEIHVEDRVGPALAGTLLV